MRFTEQTQIMTSTKDIVRFLLGFQFVLCPLIDSTIYISNDKRIYDSLAIWMCMRYVLLFFFICTSTSFTITKYG